MGREKYISINPDIAAQLEIPEGVSEHPLERRVRAAHAVRTVERNSQLSPNEKKQRIYFLEHVLDEDPPPDKDTQLEESQLAIQELKEAYRKSLNIGGRKAANLTEPLKNALLIEQTPDALERISVTLQNLTQSQEKLQEGQRTPSGQLNMSQNSEPLADNNSFISKLPIIHQTTLMSELTKDHKVVELPSDPSVIMDAVTQKMEPGIAYIVPHNQLGTVLTAFAEKNSQSPFESAGVY